jgi:nucleoside-diphosphate-sugar epimerase
MTVLVTGRAGFIGSNVCKSLLEHGENVVGIDNLVESYDGRLKDWRLAKLKKHSNFAFEYGDISDSEAMRSQFGSFKTNGEPPFSGILNLGGRAGVRKLVSGKSRVGEAGANRLDPDAVVEQVQFQRGH